MEVSDQCKEIILGTLLGDGCIIMPKKYQNARIEFRHSIVQKEYFFWKVKQLREISGDHCTRLQPADGWSPNEKYHYGSKASDFLTRMYKDLHPRGMFKVSPTWLRFLSARSLLVWWLDDGSLVKNSRQGIFCTEGFKKSNIIALSNYLQHAWGIDNSVARRGIYHQIRIYSTEALKKLLRIMLPHLKVRSMLPKFLLLYKDAQFQQRWISEVKTLTGFSDDVIEKYTRLKRAKWKNFRE